MDLHVAVIGAGRMGSFVGVQLPAGVRKTIVDSNEEAAKALAVEIGCSYGTTMNDARDADVIILTLPASVIEDVVKEVAGMVKEGSLILDMATGNQISDEVKADNPNLTFLDAKIVGSALVMKLGFPGWVVVDSEDAEMLDRIRFLLPGYSRVVSGKAKLVQELNTIGAEEGIRAAVSVRKKLRSYQISREMEDLVIRTVCVGTMLGYVDDDLGHFGKSLAERLESDD